MLTLHVSIVIIIIPLLTLSADQMEKNTTSDKYYGTIEANHMDKLFNKSIVEYKELLRRIFPLLTIITSTISSLPLPILRQSSRLLWSCYKGRKGSPSTIGRRQRGASIRPTQYVVFGGDSPPERGLLQQADIQSKGWDYSCWLCSPKILSNYGHNGIQLNTAVVFSHNHWIPQKSIQWSSPTQFAQRNIHMNFICSCKHVKMMDKVVTFVKKKTDEYFCIFAGSKLKSFQLAKALKKKPNRKYWPWM